MSGPSVQIFTTEPIGESEKLRVLAILDAIASERSGETFCLGGRPFGYYFDEPDPELSAVELKGARLKGLLGIYAGCRDPVDHVLLGMLAIRCAELLDGFVFVGDMSILTNDVIALTLEGRMIVEGVGDFVTAQHLQYWIGAPDFRLPN